MTRPRLRALVRALPLLALVGISACASGTRLHDSGPVRTPQNVRGPASWPPELRRVAVLPAHDVSRRLPADFVAVYDASWGRALSAAQRAEFVPVPRATLAAWTGRETLDSALPLPPGLLGRLADETGADAVMFLDLTEISPYPPLSLAFRARLATPDSGETVWMADELFDLRDAATARAARRDARARATGAGDPAAAVERSPARFADHAFHAVAALLPPRLPEGPETARPGARSKAALPLNSFPFVPMTPVDNPNGVPSS